MSTIANSCNLLFRSLSWGAAVLIRKNVYRTIREQIADQIRADVLAGRIQPGSNLREVSLAEKYGVSRAPVRDAFLQLAQEGVLVAKPNCGVKVGSEADQQLQPLIVELRRQIEIFALQSIFEELQEVDLQHLEQTIERLRDACRQESLGEIVEHDMAFHRHLVECAGDSDLLAIWLPIVSRMMLHYSRHTDLLDSYREHAEIIQAIRDGDLSTAIEALKSNIQ